MKQYNRTFSHKGIEKQNGHFTFFRK